MTIAVPPKNIVTIRDRTQIDAILKDLHPSRIIGRECKHATYSTHRQYERSDMLSVKEYLLLDDGTRIPRMRYMENYERPFWVTKKHLQNHPDKISFEDMENLDRFKSTQINLQRSICARLGYGNPQNPIRMLARSPYVYGLDVGPEVFVKRSYMEKWPDGFMPNHVTVVDAETDVVNPDNDKQPILWSLASDDEIVLYVNKSWANDVTDYAGEVLNEYYQTLDSWLEHIRNRFRNSKGEYPAFIDRPLTIPTRVEEFDDHFETTKGMIQTVHDSHTDILTGWNFFFDMSVMANSIQVAGYDPADILSDPTAPSDFRSLYLRPGNPVKITSSGVKMNLEPQERWDIMSITASYKPVDSMQSYWQLRKAAGKESGGYGLDAVLKRQLGVGKVTFKREDSNVPEGTLHWHRDMQMYHKVRYGVYAMFDSIGVKVKDWNDNDMESRISSLAGACDYSRFNSQPTVNTADMLFEGIKQQNKVICSTSDQMETEQDGKLLGKENWMNLTGYSEYTFMQL